MMRLVVLRHYHYSGWVDESRRLDLANEANPAPDVAGIV
ncbi:hypothetical protein FAGKG844_690002 [Frankia sp. AgKG'84/4]